MRRPPETAPPRPPSPDCSSRTTTVARLKVSAKSNTPDVTASCSWTRIVVMTMLVLLSQHLKEFMGSSCSGVASGSSSSQSSVAPSLSGSETTWLQGGT